MTWDRLKQDSCRLLENFNSRAQYDDGKRNRDQWIDNFCFRLQQKVMKMFEASSTFQFAYVKLNDNSSNNHSDALYQISEHMKKSRLHVYVLRFTCRLCLRGAAVIDLKRFHFIVAA